MLKINIPQTKFTPSIRLDSSLGLIEVKGDSLPENTLEFYASLMEEAKLYIAKPQPVTVINFELSYFNSSSSKLLYDFLDLFAGMDSQSEIKINWYHDTENENMQEAGIDFQEDFPHLNFFVIAK